MLCLQVFSLLAETLVEIQEQVLDGDEEVAKLWKFASHLEMLK